MSVVQWLQAGGSITAVCQLKWRWKIPCGGAKKQHSISTLDRDCATQSVPSALKDPSEQICGSDTNTMFHRCSSFSHSSTIKSLSWINLTIGTRICPFHKSGVALTWADLRQLSPLVMTLKQSSGASSIILLHSKRNGHTITKLQCLQSQSKL